MDPDVRAKSESQLAVTTGTINNGHCANISCDKCEGNVCSGFEQFLKVKNERKLVKSSEMIIIYLVCVYLCINILIANAFVNIVSMQR